ncbi:MAG: Asp-tRNA(Asn)/Glu-tRNA(Gln) amidotransferase subunit GatA [Clostridia bacterium]
MKSKIKTLNELLTSKQISALELTNKYIENINVLNPKLNAFITRTNEIAIKTANKVDKKIASGESISLLSGIPMCIKDNISTKNIKTTCASKILGDYSPIYDAFAVESLYDEDAVILGKANLDEFGMGSTCENSYYGATLNPFDIGKVAGGSSGGVASAVSSNMSVFGLGTDTGGSIRQPASFCGCVGLKPTYGSVSRFGAIAYCSSFDQIGPITSSVYDAAIVLDAISKKDKRDSTSIGLDYLSTKTINNDIKGKKIGIPSAFFNGLTQNIDSKIKTALKEFEEMGATIVEINLDILESVLPVYYILACAEASSNLARYDGIRYGHRANVYSDIDELITKTRDEGFGSEVKKRIMLGNYVLSSGYYDAYYKKAQILRNKIINEFDKAFENVDAIITPTVASTAFKSGDLTKSSVDMYLTDIYTVPINIASLPAISIPCGYDDDNMPIGMQIIGNRFCENTILNLAYKYEEKNSDKIYKEPSFWRE